MPSEGHDHDNHGRRAQSPPTGYRVRYRPLLAGEKGTPGAVHAAALAPAVGGLLPLVPLVHAFGTGHGDRFGAAGTLLFLTVCALALVALVNAALTVYAARAAREPVPAKPGSGTAVAFLATYAPDGVPLPAVRAVLEGAVQLRHSGPLDVWLLDEGDDPEARMLCAELGVHHFTRKGVPEWNQERGAHEAGSEHGNHNAWIAKHGDAYGLIVCVETGRVPRPGLLERMTGYFRDPDIAFVVGPPADRYEDGRHAGFRLRTLAQRAANRRGAPVLDGTCTVVRVEALRRAGGFRATASGDMVTGLDMHGRPNPLTGRDWRSVHTSEAQTDETADGSPHGRAPYGPLPSLYGKALFRMSPGRLLGYALLLLQRPAAFANWVLCALTCLLFPMSVWALAALPVALAPAAALLLTRLRERRARAAGARAVRTHQDAEHAPAASAGTAAPGS
ncbi:glycosyl transferase [Streptomyces sp. NBC_01341]|uniref:glycosyl transferase n=1 Tax=Streptomyces sp. NBC_01341 TaxID=2903831 RepID=UPI002E14435A|nr:glycosyl transferase [Streptomyces sp. NBC_01341]